MLQLFYASGPQAVGGTGIGCQPIILCLELLQRGQRPLKLADHALHRQLLLCHAGFGASQLAAHMLGLLGCCCGTLPCLTL